MTNRPAGSGFLTEATGVKPAVVGPAPTGTAPTDRNNLIAAIGDTPAGGRLWLPSSTTFYTVDQAIVVSKSMTIEGDSIGVTFLSQTAGGQPAYPMTPFLAGTV